MCVESQCTAAEKVGDGGLPGDSFASMCDEEVVASACAESTEVAAAQSAEEDFSQASREVLSRVDVVHDCVRACAVGSGNEIIEVGDLEKGEADAEGKAGADTLKAIHIDDEASEAQSSEVLEAEPGGASAAHLTVESDDYVSPLHVDKRASTPSSRILVVHVRRNSTRRKCGKLCESRELIRAMFKPGERWKARVSRWAR